MVDAASGVSGAGRGLKVTSLFSEVNENVAAYGLLTHRHTAEMEMALAHVADQPVQLLFTPHLVPMTRGILATCYARPAVDQLSTAELLGRYRAFYEGEPFVVVTDGSPATKATLGSNTAHVTVRYDERTNTVLAIGALDNPREGRVGPGDPVRQPAARPARDDRAAPHRAHAMRGAANPDQASCAAASWPVVAREPAKGAPEQRSMSLVEHRVYRAVRLEAGGLASGIKPSGAPDLAIVATTDHAPVAATGVFTSNLVAAAPVQISRIHLHDGQATAVVLNSGNANAATGEAGRRDALRMAELTAESLGCVPRDVLVCSTGLIGIPMPMDPVEAGIPKLATTLTADGRWRRGRYRDPHHRHRAQGDGPTGRAGARCGRHDRWHGQGGDARRRWPRCWRCSPPTPPSTRARCARC